MSPDTTRNFVVVFDAVQAGFSPVRLMLPGLVLAAIGAFFVFLGFHSPTRRRLLVAWTLGPAAMVWGVVWSVAAYRGTSAEYARIRDAMAAGRYTVIEGPVTDYVKERSSGTKPETWSVAGRQYVISSLRLPRTPLHPGLVKEGTYVRIADVDGQIARFEIARDSASRTSPR